MPKHMGNDTKAKVLVAMAKNHGHSIISKQIRRSKGAVSKFLAKYDKKNTLQNSYSTNNKPKVLDERTTRRLVRLALANRRATVNQLREMLETTASPTTIRRKLRENRIRARRLIKKPKLNDKQKKARLD